MSAKCQEETSHRGSFYSRPNRVFGGSAVT